MKTATILALATLTFTATARAENLNGTWSGTLHPVANTCRDDHEPLESFHDAFVVKGNTARRTSPGFGVFRENSHNNFTFRFTRNNRTDLHFSPNGDGRSVVLSFTNTFGRRDNASQEDHDCQSVWQGLFKRK